MQGKVGATERALGREEAPRLALEEGYWDWGCLAAGMVQILVGDAGGSRKAE